MTNIGRVRKQREMCKGDWERQSWTKEQWKVLLTTHKGERHSRPHFPEAVKFSGLIICSECRFGEEMRLKIRLLWF